MTEDDRSNLGVTARAGKAGGRAGAATGKKAGAAVGWGIGLAAGVLTGTAASVLALAWRGRSRSRTPK